MRRLLLLLVGILAFRGARAQEPNDLFAEIGEMTTELSRIAGLSVLRPVPHDMLDRAGLKAYIQRKIKEEVKPAEIHAEQLALVKFGFIPSDFDLEKATVDLLTEQAAAFYDYNKKRLYIIDANPGATQQMALVHELAHALADQHFNLRRFIKRAESADDRATAHMAVMEGQASWLTFEYLARKMGRSLKDDPGALKAMASAMETSTSQFPELEKAPRYLRETLLFPYTQGMLFQDRLVGKLGQQAFAVIFKQPPVSTQQVMHPEKYFERVTPVNPKPLAFPPVKGYRKLIEGSLGELDHAILLRQSNVKEAEAVAANWRGAAFQIVEDRARTRSMLSYVSEWQDAAAARQFFRLYRSVLAAKWKRFEVEQESETVLTGTGDDGRFEVRLDGPRVTSLEGIP